MTLVSPFATFVARCRYQLELNPAGERRRAMNPSPIFQTRCQLAGTRSM